jgi:hypothetical protein
LNDIFVRRHGRFIVNNSLTVDAPVDRQLSSVEIDVVSEDACVSSSSPMTTCFFTRLMAHASLSDWSVLIAVVPDVDDSILRKSELSLTDVDVDSDLVKEEFKAGVDDSEAMTEFETGFKFFRDGKLSDSTSFVD